MGTILILFIVSTITYLLVKGIISENPAMSFRDMRDLKPAIRNKPKQELGSN